MNTEENNEHEISYEAVDIGVPEDDPTFPVSLIFAHAKTTYVKPSEKKLTISFKKSLRDVNATFINQEMETLDAFYAAITSKVSGAPSDKHFIFVIRGNT